MKKRWSDEGAAEAVRRWGNEHGEDFALRLYGAQLLGADNELVLFSGGNVSLKLPYTTLLGDRVEAIYVKASGAELATLEPAELVGLDLTYLRRLHLLDALTDAELANQLRLSMFDSSGPTPSIETLLHAFLPQRFIDHTHADAVLALTNQVNGTQLVQEVMGDDVIVVPYVRPGLELAKAVAGACQANREANAVVLRHHGLITLGDDARSVYERHIALVDTCEGFVRKRAEGRVLAVSFQQKEAPSALAARVAPLLRGALAWETGNEDQPYSRSVMEWRADDHLLELVNSTLAAPLATNGPLTGDHLIHTKAVYLLVDDPQWEDEQRLRDQLTEAINTYRTEYTDYVSFNGGSMEGIDPSPRVILLPGAGLFCWATSKRDASAVADIAEHTLITKLRADAIGEYRPLLADHLFNMEHRALQRAKLGRKHDHPLQGQVVVISGGAGAIGAAVGEVCAENGGHVVLTDVDAERLTSVVEHIQARHGRGSALGVIMDVTDEKSVRAGFEEAVLEFGGVDVIVPNAGIAHVAPIDELELSDFHRVMEVNAVGYMLLMREGIRILKRQGLGGHIIISASKNVFGPGKDFGAYSASKAAGHQLGKVAAIELAPFGIRVNMINADAIFGSLECPSGLWEEVGPQRAKSRNIDPSEIPEYYRDRNLLKARIHGRHVGNAVVFFASNATPTTGATLPIDGGVVEAFPR
ncbi:MAG: bifunctional aldolase/short-chain dehydrogenase [Phycisphaerales bacterium]|nr:MAG: bifunctional aldolase/short-chain dehydrogenase [Phycisphaerales bacterium]